MTTLIEAAAKKLMTAIALDRHDVGDWPNDSMDAYLELKQAIEREKAKTRKCWTCRHEYVLLNVQPCLPCVDLSNWEPKP